MRALMIVNSHATSTTPLRRDVIAHALASELELEVVETRYRGHAVALAADAAGSGFGVVVTLGGDGTANEAVNGIMRAGGADPPALAPLPGGSANVFTRALGIPADPVDATGHILAALQSGRSRRIGLGLAGDRYFGFNAGLGFDAEVVRVVEGLRADGQPASAALYVWITVRHFFATDRRRPALSLIRDGQLVADRLYFCFVSNAAPWTYLGRRPVNPSPQASFDAGLEVFGLHRLSTAATLAAAYQMLRRDGAQPRGRHVLALHDEKGFTVAARRPIAFQVDGEYVGEAEEMTFQSVPGALRVIS
ncbi:MAG: diacylglycerol kinase family lipid kinase [Actinobacteria bacterium]|nr:diacylglycerol kinase family lipid kinase [Actinomycetota bacterium]